MAHINVNDMVRITMSIIEAIADALPSSDERMFFIDALINELKDIQAWQITEKGEE